MKLDKNSFPLFAAKYYDMKQASSVEEFQDDLKRFQYLKRLFKRYSEDDDLKTRLILNHIIVLYNCFGREATIMLFYKLDEYREYLKTFLVFLNYMPEIIVYNDVVIKSSDIKIDDRIQRELQEI